MALQSLSRARVLGTPRPESALQAEQDRSRHDQRGRRNPARGFPSTGRLAETERSPARGEHDGRFAKWSDGGEGRERERKEDAHVRRDRQRAAERGAGKVDWRQIRVT